MQPFRFFIAILLVLTLMCVIGAAALFSVGSAFYALTVMSGVAFAAFIIGGSITIGALLLLNRIALPMFRRPY